MVDFTKNQYVPGLVSLTLRNIKSSKAIFRLWLYISPNTSCEITDLTDLYVCKKKCFKLMSC